MARRELVREWEWNAGSSMFRAAEQFMARVCEGKPSPSVGDIVKMFAYGSETLRLCSGMPASNPEVLSAPVAPVVRPDLEAALMQAYAEPGESPWEKGEAQ